MATRWAPALCLVAGFLGNANAAADFDPLQYVDVLIGSTNAGNVFPGATLPYGMAKAVADTNSGSNQDDINRCDFPKKTRVNHGNFTPANVKAQPGYFSILLDIGVRAEMTTTQHTALFRFSLPNGPGANGTYPFVMQDLSDLSDSRQDNGTVSVDPQTGRISGGAKFLPSFGSGNYNAYFCTDFTGPAIQDSGIYVNSRATTEAKDLTISRSINGYPLPGGAFVRFKDATNPILARTGVSLISTAQACANAEAEIPDFNFDSVTKAAKDAWTAKLSPISVSTGGGVAQDLITNFYSGIYRTMVNPQNYTGENPLYKSGEPYFDSFYCLWDSFRSQIPFLVILDPVAVAQMIRSLIDTYRYEGWLPDCKMSLCRGYTQGGSNADNVLVDAYLKGISDGIDWNVGYQAVVKDAEVEPYDWATHGRGGLDSWKKLGYIPVQDLDYKGFGTMTRSISRSLEYAYNDFCISLMAKAMNNTADQEKYLDSSENWKNVFYSEQTSFLPSGVDTGFKGFFQAKYLNQTWASQDPLTCSNIDTSGIACSLQNTGRETFEDSTWEYGFFVPQNQGDLITIYGGPGEYVRRLDYLHDQNITNIGNVSTLHRDMTIPKHQSFVQILTLLMIQEPSFLTVFQYHYAGRPGKSAARSHFYIPRYFNPTPGGLPGNDDSGAMGSFVAFSMMGLFPNPGQNVYLITPPFFESVNLTHPTTGKTATIRNVNFDPTYQAIYIQSATLNGQPYTKNWIDHSFFLEGKELVLTLGRNESATWGTSVKDLPPSTGRYVGFNGTSSDQRLRGRSALKYRSEAWRMGAFAH
ncbi:hypothetical protein PG996_002643 [Apiospora saccharicola]|uniref:Glycoside hydrolase family 92 protein n=1 Tax=Apiospora saccharicola TaxID=335842 RepID=A0ABR1WK35_9PEZI